MYDHIAKTPTVFERLRTIVYIVKVYLIYYEALSLFFVFVL